MSMDVFESWSRENSKCMKCGNEIVDKDIWWCALTEAFEIGDDLITEAKCNWDESLEVGDVGINIDWTKSILICKECMENFLGYVALKK